MRVGIAVICLSAMAGLACAHFGMIIPSVDIVTPEEGRVLKLRVMFAHPFEGHLMEMERPAEFGVLFRGRQRTSLLDLLRPVKLRGYADDKPHQAWEAEYRLRRPGDYVFYLVPKPYWEPAEGKMIVHYTKVVVDAFGAEEGWDAMVGFPVEIEPLVRPYGLWTGNAFRGVVKKDGKPVPFAEIEVEYYNEGKRVGIPADPFTTQVIKADAGGVFTYVMPRAGWWSFVALLDGDEKMANPAGKKVDVELGALIWVRTVDMK